jgi:carboxyl-terminal processing protease
MLQQNKSYRFWLPIAFSLIFILGMFIGKNFSSQNSNNFQSTQSDMAIIQEYLNEKYFDTLPKDFDFNATAMNQVLQTLDPFSVYIPASKTEEVNAPLEGSFEGIGVYFTMLHDTVYVEEVILGGPAEQVGLHVGDRLISVDGHNIAGQQLNSDDIVKQLKGKGGTKVKVGILRRGSSIKYCTITRGKIPIYSVDAAYLLSANVGYVKINKFSETTGEEFRAAMDKITQQGAKSLVLDLRGNGGGYLSAAIEIAGAFLPENQLITYTKGLHESRQDLFNPNQGQYVSMPLTILIDEGSASASEIVSGAMQDLDRATIIGRRSFGKGLVQGQYELPSGANLRLTIARYYTPSGRCIQKDFSDKESFNMDVSSRYINGEVFGKGKKQTGKAFKTKNGRTVYDGSGITPDYFVQVDTNGFSGLWNSLFDHGVIIDFSDFQFTQNGIDWKKSYANSEEFIQKFPIQSKMDELKKYAIENGIKWNEKDAQISAQLIRKYLMAQLAKKVFGQEAYIRVLNSFDETVLTAVKKLS